MKLITLKDQHLGREKSIPDLAEIRVDGIGFGAEGAELAQAHHARITRARGPSSSPSRRPARR